MNQVNFQCIIIIFLGTFSMYYLKIMRKFSISLLILQKKEKNEKVKIYTNLDLGKLIEFLIYY